MKMLFGFLCALLCCCAAIADDAVRELSKHLGKTPALVVVVCGPDGGDLATIGGLVEKTPWTLFCRGPVSPGMDKIRDWAREKRLLGRRVYVADDDSPSLQLAGDLADAVWVATGVEEPPPEKEILRVLHPGGVCVASGKVSIKSAQGDVDEWRQLPHRLQQPQARNATTAEMSLAALMIGSSWVRVGSVYRRRRGPGPDITLVHGNQGPRHRFGAASWQQGPQVGWGWSDVGR